MVPLTPQQYTPVSSAATVILSEGVVSFSVVPSLVHCISVPGGGGCEKQLNVVEAPTLDSKLVIGAIPTCKLWYYNTTTPTIKPDDIWAH